MAKTYCVGDIHGCYKQLVNCIEHSNIMEGDRLIFLGDYVDRGPQSYEVVDYIIKLREKYEVITIRGNHDETFFQSMTSGKNLLFNQGGKETLESYIRNCNPEKTITYTMSGYKTNFTIEDYLENHYRFFRNLLPYYIDKENNFFVHGGFNRHKLIEETGRTHGDISDLWWDRDLLHAARSYSTMKNNEYKFKMKNDFKEVFVGHTPVQYFDKTTPQNYANIWALDCGVGKFTDGTVCIMNIETKEFKQF